jgi:hypothetical protein
MALKNIPNYLPDIGSVQLSQTLNNEPHPRLGQKPKEASLRDARGMFSDATPEPAD